MSETQSPSPKKCKHCKPKFGIDSERRRFLSLGMRLLASLGAVCALYPFAAALKPNQKILEASGSLDIDISALQPGQQMTVMWRGKPVWIIRRTAEMLKNLNKLNIELRDPDSLVKQQPVFAQNIWRSLRPEYLVMIGVCTHLGCIPEYKIKAPIFYEGVGGFYCPCHGSRFDLAGRVYRNVPAPINMEIPMYRFIQDHVIRLGEAP